MSIDTTPKLITPLCDDVVVLLDNQLGNPPALEVIDQVVRALEDAGRGTVADAFLVNARECATDGDVLLLARCTVTVL